MTVPLPVQEGENPICTEKKDINVARTLSPTKRLILKQRIMQHKQERYQMESQYIDVKAGIGGIKE